MLRENYAILHLHKQVKEEEEKNVNNNPESIDVLVML